MKLEEIKSISEIQDAIKDVLKQNMFFEIHDVTILCENAKDIDYEIKSAISRLGILATVNTPDLTFIGKYENKEPAWKMNGIEITIAEIPITNRGRANYATALDTGLQVGETLNELDNLNLVGIQQSEMNGYLLVTVTFDSNIIFRYDKTQVEHFNKGN